MRRPPFQPPPLRIEPPEPEPPPPPSAGLGNRARIAAAGLAGLALGFLLAVSLRPSDEPAATTVEPLTEVAPSSTVPMVAAANSFPGRLVVVTGASGAEVVARAVDPGGATTVTGRLVDGLLPTTLSWNADRSAAGGLGRGPAGTALYAGPVDAMVPVTLAASSFAWHGTDPGRIAWTERTESGENLFTGDLLARDFTLLEVGPVDGPVVGWGEWGYLIQSFHGDTRVHLVRPSGTISEPGSISSANTHYRTVPVVTDPAEPPELVVLDVISGQPLALDLGPTAFQVTVAPELRRAAWVVQTGAREAELRVQSFDQPEPAVIPIPPAQLLDWSPDGSLMVLQATMSRIEQDSVFRWLLVVEVATGEVYQVPLERGDVLGAAIGSEAP